MRWRALGAVASTIALMALAARGEQTASPLYDDADLLFLQHMIVHHEQALLLCALVPERSSREAFRRFARYVDRAQAAEIEMMRSLLDLAAERGVEIPAYHPHGDPPMAGMLPTAEIEAIGAARGPDFERRWLEGMIVHHEGALAMARAQQLQQLETGRRPYGIAVLVEDILEEQRAEIAQMRAWLREWGLEAPAGPPGDDRRGRVSGAGAF
jgi:uncharacterized protein (DUF305 family)